MLGERYPVPLRRNAHVAYIASAGLIESVADGVLNAKVSLHVASDRDLVVRAPVGVRDVVHHRTRSGATQRRSRQLANSGNTHKRMPLLDQEHLARGRNGFDIHIFQAEAYRGMTVGRQREKLGLRSDPRCAVDDSSLVGSKAGRSDGLARERELTVGGRLGSRSV